MIISFVTKDGAANNADMVSDFESLTRDVASSVGGLPVEMRLVTSTLTLEKDETVTAQTGAQPGNQTGTQQPGTQQPGTQQPGTATTRVEFHGDHRNEGPGRLLRYGY